MNAALNWLRCLLTGHRYDNPVIGCQHSRSYCDCCGRELFNRAPLPAEIAPTPSDSHFTGGEGQAKEGWEGENQQPMDAADAAHIVKAINSGRMATTTSAAIASQRNSLDCADACGQYTFVTGSKDFLSKDVGDRRFWIVPKGAGA
ncbi:hypothetical protein [Oxalicibacterium faecigallinarum]|nr:hypothetical protein [Oxalicibacterium faecigallinarum]